MCQSEAESLTMDQIEVKSSVGGLDVKHYRFLQSQCMVAEGQINGYDDLKIWVCREAKFAASLPVK